MSEAFVPLEWRSLPVLPERDPLAHKGNFGHAFVIGGGPGMGGALALACAAAYRVGAGLVTAMGHPSALPYLAAHLPEATWRDWPGSLEDLPAAAVLAVGPGLGQGLAAHDLVREIGTRSGPQVWDADALNILARFGPDLLRGDAVRLFTPHPGEAARLLRTTTAAVQSDRATAIGRLRARYGGHWVLKGHHSLLLGSGGRWFCPQGNPGMATGGSGDVLTGLLAGLLAIGLEADAALSLGVCLHAHAGDLAAAQIGEASLLAGDILAAVPAALQELRKNHAGY